MNENATSQCPPGGKIKERHLSCNHGDGEGGMCPSAILTAAIGLKSLGTPASQVHPPTTNLNDDATLSKNTAAAALALVAPRRAKPTQKKAQITKKKPTPPKKRKTPMAAVSVSIATNAGPVPLPKFNDRLQLPPITIIPQKDVRHIHSRIIDSDLLMAAKNEDSKPKKLKTPPENRKPTVVVATVTAVKPVTVTRPTMSSIYNKDKPLQLPLLIAQKDDRMGMDPSTSKGVPSMPPPSHFSTPCPCDHTLFPQRYPKLSNPSDHTIRSVDLDPLTLPPKRQKVNQRSWMTPFPQQAQTLRSPGLGVMCEHGKTNAQKMALPHSYSYPHMGMGTTNVAMTSSCRDSTITKTTFTTSITLNFPEILYEILSDPANRHILSWLPHGKGFVIHDRQLFVSHILPQNFDGAKFTSFTRRLKRWKFQRVPRGPEMGAYFNKYFVRDKPDLVSGMMYGIIEQGGERGDETTDSDVNEQMKIMAVPPLPLSEEENKCDYESDDKSNCKSNVKSDKGDGKMVDKMMKKKGESSNKDETDSGIDDVVTVAAMELHRQQQRMQRRLKRDINEERVMHNNTIELQSETANEKKAKVSAGPTESNRSSASSADAAHRNAMVAVGVELRRQHQWLQQQLNNDDDGGDRCKRTKTKEKRNETKKESSEGGASFGAVYDNAVVEAAMEIHRQQHHRKQQSQLQQKHLPKESENDGSSEKIPKSSYEEDAWMHPQQQDQRSSAPSRRRSSSSENLSLMSHDSSFRNRPVMPRSRGGSLTSTHACSNHPPASIVPMAHLLNDQHQQHQLERQQRSSEDSSSLNPNMQSRCHYHNLRNESVHASQLRHQEDPMKSQKKTSTPGIPKELHMRTNLPTPYNPSQGNSSLDRLEMYNPEDYLSVSTSRRVSLTGNMPMTHHTDKFHDMVLSRERNATLSQHPYDISSSDYSSIQQQYLINIEQQILSEMSGDSLLHTESSPGQFSSSSYLSRGSGERYIHDPLSTNGYPKRRSRSDCRGMTNRGDRMSVAMLNRDRMLDNGTFMDLHDIRINSHDRFQANEDMAERILASSNTHKEIMLMAARDLQSRDLGGRLGLGSTALLEYHQLPIHLQQGRLSREHLLMQDQQQLQLSQDHLPIQDQQKRQMQDQQQHLLSSTRLRQQQLSHLSSLRTRYPSYHAMMLRFRELEEKVGLETLAAEAAASGLRERREREGGGASAA